MADRLFSTYQVADLLGATPGAVVEWMEKGWLPYRRIPNGPVRISEMGLIHFLKSRGVNIDEVMAKAVVRQQTDQQTPEQQYQSATAAAGANAPLTADMVLQMAAEAGAEKSSRVTESPAAARNETNAFEQGLRHQPEEEAPQPVSTKHPELRKALVSAAKLTDIQDVIPGAIGGRRIEGPSPVIIEAVDQPAAKPAPANIDATVRQSADEPLPTPQQQPVPAEPARIENVEPAEAIEVQPDAPAAGSSVSSFPQRQQQDAARTGTSRTTQPAAASPAEHDESTASVEPEQPLSLAHGSAIIGGLTAAAQLAEAIIRDAARAGATHVHLSPAAGRLHLSLRVGGVVREKPQFARKLAAGLGPMLVEHLRGRCGMWGEAASQASGVFRIDIDGRGLDVNLSVLPCPGGAMLVMNIGHEAPTLASFNLPPDELAAMEKALAAPGLILAAGESRSDRAGLLEAMLQGAAKANRRVVAIVRPGQMPPAGAQGVLARGPIGGLLRSLAGADVDVVVADGLDDPSAAIGAIELASAGVTVLASLAAPTAADAMAELVEMTGLAWPISRCLSGVLVGGLLDARRRGDNGDSPRDTGTLWAAAALVKDQPLVHALRTGDLRSLAEIAGTTDRRLAAAMKELPKR